MRMDETKVAGNDNKVDPNVILSLSLFIPSFPPSSVQCFV
jgi:hypothetical protein